MDTGAPGELGASAAKTVTRGTGRGEEHVFTLKPLDHLTRLNAQDVISTRLCATCTRLVIVS